MNERNAKIERLMPIARNAAKITHLSYRSVALDEMRSEAFLALVRAVDRKPWGESDKGLFYQFVCWHLRKWIRRTTLALEELEDRAVEWESDMLHALTIHKRVVLLLASANPQQRAVMEGFLCGLTGTEIGARLGVRKSRVCRILKGMAA